MIAHKIQKTLIALILALGLVCAAQADPITLIHTNALNGPIQGYNTYYYINGSWVFPYPYVGPGAPTDLPPLGTMIPNGMSLCATGGDVQITFNGAGSPYYDLLSLVAPTVIKNIMGQAFSN